MIMPLDHRQDKAAKAILSVQLAAYQEEAELLQFFDLPPLKDDMASVKRSEESFYGYFAEELLAGVISIEETNHSWLICRLAVHPDHFRKGIGRKLLKYIVKKTEGAKLTVCTASSNLPAIELYKSMGFTKSKEWMAGQEIQLSCFDRIEESKNDQ